MFFSLENASQDFTLVKNSSSSFASPPASDCAIPLGIDLPGHGKYTRLWINVCDALSPKISLVTFRFVPCSYSWLLTWAMADDGFDLLDTDMAEQLSEPSESDECLDENDQVEIDPDPDRRLDAESSDAVRVARSGIIPRNLLAIIAILLSHFQHGSVLDGVELFAGSHSVSAGMNRYGYSCLGLDCLTVHASDDINTTPGFIRALTYILALDTGGLLWAAPPCSTWVFLNKGTSGRTRTDPLGKVQHRSVSKANEQVARVVLLILVAVLISNAYWMTEQPGNSLLECHPRWALLQDLFNRFWKLHMWMQPYGGSSPKATLLYSNMVGVESLFLARDPQATSEVQTVERYVNAEGQECFKGSADLKGTQAYPRDFGMRVSEKWQDARVLAFPQPGIPLQELLSVTCSDDPWDDARLNVILADLQASVS